MPPGRTSGNYGTTTLTDEEAAALAAEQAAAYGSDYAPAEPPPADAAPVAVPVSAPQTTMYQPSSPPPAAAPAAEPYTSISPQVTDTSNPSVEPGYSAPASERRDSYTTVNQAYQPAAPWSSISPQDSGNASRNAYPVSVSDFRDPLKTPESQAAQSTRYQPSDPGRQNTQDFRSSFGDNLGRSLGLDPNDPNTDMANQLRQRGYDWLGDRAPEIGKTLAETAGREIPKAIDQMYLGPLRTLADPVANGGILAGPIGNLLNAEWGLAEDTIGPEGNLLHQWQSTANPLGAAISGFTQPKTDALRDIVDEGKKNWDTFNDRSGKVIRGDEDAGDAALDFLSFPLPTAGQDTPHFPDPASTSLDLTVPFKLRGLAEAGGFNIGVEARKRTNAATQGGIATPELAFTPPSLAGWETEARDRATTAAQGAAATTQQQVQEAKGAAIGARMRGGTPLDAALAAARTVGVPSLQLPSVSLSGLAPARETVPNNSLAGAYVPRDPERGATLRNAAAEEAVIPGKVQGAYVPREPAPDRVGGTVYPARSNLLFPTDMPWSRGETPVSGSTGSVRTSGGPSLTDRVRDLLPGGEPDARGYDSVRGQYVPREPNAQLDPTVIQRARDAATAAKDWVGNLSMPDINLPGRGVQDIVPAQTVGNGQAPLTLRRTTPEGIDPNALYMPEAPPPTLMDRVRGAGSDVVQGISNRIPDVNLPSVSMPDINLPGRGGTPTDTGQRWAPPAQGTAKDPLQAVFEGGDIAARAPRSTTVPDGMTASQETGPDGSQHTWVLNANNEYTGVVDPNTGEYVMFPEGATPEELKALVDGILGAPAAKSSAPGPATSAPSTTTSTTGSTSPALNTNTGTSSNAGSNSGGSGGGGSTSYDNTTYSGGSRSSGKRSTSSSDDDGYDSAPLKLEDFFQDFDGDGTIGKRDRMQGKQAFEQAKMLRSKKRRGKTTSRKGTTSQFPFDRQASPIRQSVLNAIAESQGR